MQTKCYKFFSPVANVQSQRSMIFCFLIFNIFAISVGRDHLYGTGLDIGQKIDFKSASGGIWILLDTPRDEIAGLSSLHKMKDSRIRMLKRANKRQAYFFLAKYWVAFIIFPILGGGGKTLL